MISDWISSIQVMQVEEVRSPLQNVIYLTDRRYSNPWDVMSEDTRDWLDGGW
ncbi:hypothetical protein H6F93_12290 [Leptolyngbya sp. FACHB-671]|uniref:hypothetical protein n=1 Tax=Leptolyngbya sp. FACHB-671 TaxID=2692812 RepID=UPI0016889AFC|nr:hypothetical protein [Leptolyngbya sp. FACHB-671]MBD2068291.1 hypothetical protein [Leptolyngbya sp. FACHB-671]